MPASRRSAASCVASSSVGGRPGGRTQSASISVPSRCAERHARRRMRCDFGCGSTSASTRSATACWLSGSSDARRAPRLDVLGDLAQRELPQRREVVGPEEVLERDRRPLRRVDLAGPEPLLQLLRREVDEHDLVGLVEDPVGERLAHADPVSSKIASLRLSRCWTLTVEMTSMPASSTSSMSCQRFSFRIPGAFVCASSSISASSGARADHGVDVHLLELERPVLRAQPRHDLEPLGERRRLGAVVRLEVADHDVLALLLRLPALVEHPVRLADSCGHPEQDPVVAARRHRLTPRAGCGRPGRSA